MQYTVIKIQLDSVYQSVLLNHITCREIITTKFFLFLKLILTKQIHKVLVDLQSWHSYVLFSSDMHNM